MFTNETVETIETLKYYRKRFFRHIGVLALLQTIPLLGRPDLGRLALTASPLPFDLKVTSTLKLGVS